MGTPFRPGKKVSNSTIVEDPHGPCVLVVEDDLATCDVLQSTLRLAGYRVRCAHEGADVMALAQSFKPQLVLMDLMLPGVDGWEATEHLRASEEFSDVPIVAVSARTRREDRDRALAAGVSEFVPKPCRPRKLIEIVGRYLPV